MENKYAKHHLNCDVRDSCIQHPLVCLNCNRRTDLKDCYKVGTK